MKLALPQFILDRIKADGMTRRELVLRMGYRNETRGLRRLQSWLSGERWPEGDQASRLAAALGVGEEEIVRLIDHDENEVWIAAKQQRASDPRYYLHIRYMPCVYGIKELPEGISEEEAVRIASELTAKELHHRTCLNTPSSKNYWINEDGSVDVVTEGPGPYMTLRRRAFRLTFKS